MADVISTKSPLVYSLAAIAVIVVAGLMIATQMGWIQGQSGGGLLQEGIGDNQVLQTQAVCQTDGTNSLLLSVRNPQNASSHYNSQTCYATDGSYDVDGLVASGTTTAATTRTDATLNVPCSTMKGGVVCPLSATMNSAEGTFDMDGAQSDDTVLTAAPAGSLALSTMDSTLTNTSNSTIDGSEAGCTNYEITATAVASGGSFSRYIDYKQATAFKQFGSLIAGKPGILIGINNNQTAIKKGDCKIADVEGNSNIQSIDCQDYANTADALQLEECYTANPQGSKDATARIKVECTANGGDPASDVSVWFVDLGYISDTDGSMVYEGYDNGGTAGGQTNCVSYINLS